MRLRLTTRRVHHFISDIPWNRATGARMRPKMRAKDGCKGVQAQWKWFEAASSGEGQRRHVGKTTTKTKPEGQ